MKRNRYRADRESGTKKTSCRERFKQESACNLRDYKDRRAGHEPIEVLLVIGLYINVSAGSDVRFGLSGNETKKKRQKDGKVSKLKTKDVNGMKQTSFLLRMRYLACDIIVRKPTEKWEE